MFSRMIMSTGEGVILGGIPKAFFKSGGGLVFFGGAIHFIGQLSIWHAFVRQALAEAALAHY